MLVERAEEWAGTYCRCSIVCMPRIWCRRGSNRCSWWATREECEIKAIEPNDEQIRRGRGGEILFSAVEGRSVVLWGADELSLISTLGCTRVKRMVGTTEVEGTRNGWQREEYKGKRRA